MSLSALVLLDEGCVTQKQAEEIVPPETDFLIIGEAISEALSNSENNLGEVLDCKTIWFLDDDKNAYEVVIAKEGGFFTISVNEELVLSNDDLTDDEKKRIQPMLLNAYELVDTIQTTENMLQEKQGNPKSPIARFYSSSSKKSMTEMRYGVRVERAQKELIELIHKTLEVLNTEEPVQEDQNQPVKPLKLTSGQIKMPLQRITNTHQYA